MKLWGIVLILALAFPFEEIECSDGDADPLYRTCVENCEVTSLVGEIQVKDCQFSDAILVNETWKEPFYMQWKQSNCKCDCRYHCMIRRESERKKLGLDPVKYHERWPFKRFYIFQEPVSVGLSALNLIVHLMGWFYFFMSVNYKDIDVMERLEYSSALVLLGYSLILSLLRTFNVKNEAARVVYSAPFIAFVTIHIMFLNFYKYDYGWNMKVCFTLALWQFMNWTVWAGVSCHPARIKLWTVVFGGALAMLLETSDFPPYFRYVDARAIRHAVAVPLTYLWWSFARADAEFRTSALVQKLK